MLFHIDKTMDGAMSWWLYSGSDLVAWAGESFPSTGNAERAAKEFKAGAATARFEVYLDEAGEWRWRAWRSSDKVAACGEGFISKYNAERAADNVRFHAADATGP